MKNVLLQARPFHLLARWAMLDAGMLSDAVLRSRVNQVRSLGYTLRAGIGTAERVAVQLQLEGQTVAAMDAVRHSGSYEPSAATYYDVVQLAAFVRAWFAQPTPGSSDR